MKIGDLLTALSWRDVLDFVLLYVMAYGALRVVRRTRAVPVALALLVIGALAGLVRWLDLIATATVLRYFFDSFILILIVVFRQELRRGLLLFGQRLMPHRAVAGHRSTVQEIVTAVDRIVRGGVGTMIALQGRMDLAEVASDPGRAVDAPVRADLLVALAVPHPANLAHDGAIVIDGDRIVRAGLVCPLTVRTDLDPRFGTRHRGAIGLSEDSDALVIVVSEERGEIRVAYRGEISAPLTLGELQDRLDAFVGARRGSESEGARSTDAAAAGGRP
ncbi:MAG: TIGR00159 family protein [Deltaproteobacteria bacterium]|nr:MAG: TIGR00159 family protein [Deltaproteobacteria bacterium]